MREKTLRKSKLAYIAFVVPPILAYLSWQYFPELVERTITQVFQYKPSYQPTTPIWYWVAGFFYTWYTFLAIGAAGIWALAAAFVSKNLNRAKPSFYPRVSIIIPAYNEEKNISGCIKSLFGSAERYQGLSELVVVDDGSTDLTYEVAWAAIKMSRGRFPNIRGRVIRHSANLGKSEAISTGLNSSLGSLVAIVDADSCWMPNTLEQLVDNMLLNGKKAVTGYVHPSDRKDELNPFVLLQQLEYSQGLGVARRAQSLGSKVTVVSGAIGLYDADILHKILDDKQVQSVTEDLEITLEIHKRGASVGYVSEATSQTIVPHSLNLLWNQRLRWFTGWLHNTLRIHKDQLVRKSWLTFILWYCYIFEYGGALVDITALAAFPFLFWFSPDRILFAAGLLIFIPYGLLIGLINQSIALKLAYDHPNYRNLLFYTPFYPILRLINMLARLTSSMKFILGNNGTWHHTEN